MRYIKTLIVLLMFSLNVYSESPQYIIINYIPFEAESPFSITPSVYDSLYIHDSDSCVISDSIFIKTFVYEIESMDDVITEPHTPDRIVRMFDGRELGIQLYPQMDTRGKIIIVYANKNVILYFSNFKIWNKTEDKIYKMEKHFKDLIQIIFNRQKGNKGLKIP